MITKENINLRIEKKSDKYIGPKLVDINTHRINHHLSELQTMVKDLTGIIIIGVRNKKTGKNHLWTTLDSENTVYHLEAVKKVL